MPSQSERQSEYICPACHKADSKDHHICKNPLGQLDDPIQELYRQHERDAKDAIQNLMTYWGLDGLVLLEEVDKWIEEVAP